MKEAAFFFALRLVIFSASDISYHVYVVYTYFHVYYKQIPCYIESENINRFLNLLSLSILYRRAREKNECNPMPVPVIAFFNTHN